MPLRWVKRAVRGVAALAVALPLSACAAMFGGYDLAPNGLTRDEESFRRDLAFQAPRAYQSVIDGRRALPDDDLLRLLYAGIAGRYAGAHEESSRLLDVASYLAEDRVTLSLSREALSLITSDRALAYVPGPTERLMIPYLAALNYLEAGDYQGAAVEARRIEALLDQQAGDPAARDPQRAFLHYFAGTVFEAAREWNAADVAYRRAQRAGGSPGDGSSAWSLEPGLAPGDSVGEVVVLVEQGFVPHRVEQSVVIVVPGSRVKMLTEGSAGEKAAAAAESAARILLTASHHYGERSGFHRDQRYRSPLSLEPWDRDDDEEGDTNPYLLRISWPVLYQEPRPVASLRVMAGDVASEPVTRLDVGAGIRRDFDGQRATTLARTVARAASKLAISTAVEHSVTQHDEAAGRIAGLLTNLGTLATERADTRAWHLLPGDVSLVRVRLPPGTHGLTLDTGAAGSGIDLGEVEVRAGQLTFVNTRLWR